MNGIFLLDTILQTPVQSVSRSICIDIQRHEVCTDCVFRCTHLSDQLFKYHCHCQLACKFICQ